MGNIIRKIIALSFIIVFPSFAFAIEFQVVESNDQVEDFLRQAKTAKLLSIDTEFFGHSKDSTRIRLIQVGIVDELNPSAPAIYLLDLAKIKNPIESLEEFLRLFGDESVVKIFHAPEADFTLLAKIVPDGKISNIWDTQWAHSLLSQDYQIGYGQLVQRYLKIEISKEEQNSNWQRQQLTESQQAYAARDVLYLPEIYFMQVKALSEKDLLEVARKEFYQRYFSPDPGNELKKGREKFRLKAKKSPTLLKALEAAKQFRDELSRKLGIAREVLAMESELKVLLLGRPAPKRFTSPWRWSLFKDFFAPENLQTEMAN